MRDEVFEIRSVVKNTGHPKASSLLMINGWLVYNQTDIVRSFCYPTNLLGFPGGFTIGV